MSEVRTVAVLGTGIMGAPMARNLAEAGVRTRAWNRSREKAAPLSDDGVEVAETPAEAVDGADAAITILADADAVRAVTFGDEDALSALGEDAVWVQMSTVGVTETEELAAGAAERGVTFADCPVLGTRQPAEAGELTVLASGPDEALGRCEPVFDAVGSRTFRLGETGAGTRMKLVLNDWLLAITAGLAETVAFARRLGVEPERFLEVIDGSPMGVPYAQIKGRMMVEEDFPTAFPLRLAAKDAGLVLDAASADGDPMPLTRAIRERYAEAIERGLSEEDMAAVYRVASQRG